MSTVRCVECKREILPGEATFEIRTFLDPFPPDGVACSPKCQSEKENESRMRTLLLYNSPLNPYTGGKDD
jgi:predicted amidophosphoribosyltransferase